MRCCCSSAGCAASDGPIRRSARTAGRDRGGVGVVSNGGGGRLQWSTVSARVAGRSDWKREGSDLRGPCPVTFAGGRTCWIGEGVDGGIRLGCHHCGGRLDGPAYVEHARALGLLDGAAFPGARRPAAPLPRPVEPLPALGPDPAVSHVWNAAQPIQANDPGGGLIVRPARQGYKANFRRFLRLVTGAVASEVAAR